MPDRLEITPDRRQASLYLPDYEGRFVNVSSTICQMGADLSRKINDRHNDKHNPKGKPPGNRAGFRTVGGSKLTFTRDNQTFYQYSLEIISQENGYYLVLKGTRDDSLILPELAQALTELAIPTLPVRPVLMQAG